MGIKNLKHIITKYAPSSIKETNLSDYSGKIIAIDTSIYLYRFIYKEGDPIELLIKQIIRLYKNNITPLYIFDGKPPKEKTELLQERQEKKKELQNRHFELQNIIYDVEQKIQNEDFNIEYELNLNDLKLKLEKVEKQIIYVTSKHINESKELFRLMGVQYIVANGEAETLCAELSKRNLVIGCLSEDTDILANGGKIFLRNFNVYSNKITEYNLDKLLELLEITYDEFIDMCILCGCDYTSTIGNIGIERAYKYIHKYKKIENLIEYINIINENLINKGKQQRYFIPDDFDYIKSRKLLKNEEDKNDYIKINLELSNHIKNSYDKKNLLHFLIEKSISQSIIKEIEKIYL